MVNIVSLNLSNNGELVARNLRFKKNKEKVKNKLWAFIRNNKIHSPQPKSYSETTRYVTSNTTGTNIKCPKQHQARYVSVPTKKLLRIRDISSEPQPKAAASSVPFKLHRASSSTTEPLVEEVLHANKDRLLQLDIRGNERRASRRRVTINYLTSVISGKVSQLKWQAHFFSFLRSRHNQVNRISV